MKNNSTRNMTDVRALLFVASYIVLVYHSMFSKVVFLGDFIFGRHTYHAALLILGFLAFLNVLRISRKRILSFIAVTLVLSASSFIAKDLFLIVIWLMVLAAKDLNLKSLIKIDIIIKIIGFIIVLLAFKIGLTNVEIYYREGVIRQTLGFNNPNSLSNYVLSIYVGILFLSQKKNRLFKVVIALASMLIIYFVAGSRTQIIGLLLVSALIALRGKIRGKYARMLKAIMPFLFTICAAVSYVATMAYIEAPGRMEWLNELLSGRLWLAAKAFRNYGIGIIGNIHMTKGMLDYPIDNIYMNIAIIHGVIPLIALGLFIYKFTKYLIDNKKYNDLVILSTFVLLGMSESELFKPYYNPYIAESSNMLLKGARKKKEVA